MAFDQRQFRNALGLFPTGVIVLTGTTASGGMIGMTMSSFNAVSLDPPLVLFSLRRSSFTLKEWQDCSSLAIHVLTDGQEDLSRRFARPGAEKFDGLYVEASAGGAPILTGALAVFECKPYARYDGGDHEIFVVEVVDVRLSTATHIHPIVFFKSEYCSLSTRTAHAAPIEYFGDHGW